MKNPSKILLLLFLVHLKICHKISTQMIVFNSQSICQAQQNQFRIKVAYIWLNDLPKRHKNMLNHVYRQHQYEFRVIRDCKLLLHQIVEKSIKQYLNQDILQKVHLQSDICRYAYLYQYGGLYRDMDADLDYECFKEEVKDMRSPQIYFQATSINTIDIFGIYTPQAKNPYLKKVIQSFITYNSFQVHSTAPFNEVPSGYKIIKRSGCINHKQQRAWKQNCKKQQEII